MLNFPANLMNQKRPRELPPPPARGWPHAGGGQYGLKHCAPQLIAPGSVLERGVAEWREYMTAIILPSRVNLKRVGDDKFTKDYENPMYEYLGFIYCNMDVQVMPPDIGPWCVGRALS